MDLSHGTGFFQSLLYFFENFVSVYEPLINTSFDVPVTQMSIFIIFLSAGVLFEGDFPLVNFLKLSLSLPLE